MAKSLAWEITQVKEAIPWVRCASGNVFKIFRQIFRICPSTRDWLRSVRTAVTTREIPKSLLKGECMAKLCIVCISRQTLQNSSGKLYKTIIQQLPQTSYPQILAPSRWHNTHQKLAHPFHPTLLMTSHCSQMFSRGPGLIHHQWKDLNGSLQHRNKPFENLRKNQGWGVALEMFFGSRRKDIQSGWNQTTWAFTENIIYSLLKTFL